MPKSVSKGFDTAMKRAHQDDSNDTPKPICECQVDFPLQWIKEYPGLSREADLKLTYRLWGTYPLNHLDEPVFIAVSKPLLTEFGIHHRFESCAQ